MKMIVVDSDPPSKKRFKFPNLACMKLSAYHKKRGDSVDFFCAGLPEPKEKYDKAYISKVFTATGIGFIPEADETEYGGTGFHDHPDICDWRKTLPDDIEHQTPDYGLYNIHDRAYGYLTRGCPRGCGFCFVGEKEGRKTIESSPLKEFWRGENHITLLDPNLLSYTGKQKLLTELADTRAYVDITQGIDARTITGEDIELLRKIKLESLHCAWDNIKDESAVLRGLELIKTLPLTTVVYILCGYNSTFEEDLYRVEKLHSYKNIMPYVMYHENTPRQKRYIQLRLWVNSKLYYKTNKTFSDFIKNSIRIHNRARRKND